MTPRAVASVSAIALLIAVFWAFLERSRKLAVGRDLVVLTKIYDELQRERDGLRDENGRLNRQVTEFTSKQSVPDKPAIPTAEDNSDGTIERVGQLKRVLLLHPEYGLPEFDLLTDGDWLNAAESMKKDTEMEVRNALERIRQVAKQKFLSELREAERSYQIEHGHRARDPQLLKRYLYNPVHEHVLDRYEAWSGEALGRRDWYFRERAGADEWYDSRVFVSAESHGLMAVGLWADIGEAAQKFKNERGHAPRNAFELRPYLKSQVNDRVLSEIFSTAAAR